MRRDELATFVIDDTETQVGDNTLYPFKETFYDNERDWETADNTDGYTQYDDLFSGFVDGQYVIRIENGSLGWIVAPGFTDWSQAPIFEDSMSLSVTVASLEISSSDVGVSVYFNVQEYYAGFIGFSIYPDGQYYVFGNSGEIQGIVDDFAIDLLDGEPHVITVHASVSEYAFFVDDQEIVRTPSYGLIEGTVGLGISMIPQSGWHDIEVHFDDL